MVVLIVCVYVWYKCRIVFVIKRLENRTFFEKMNETNKMEHAKQDNIKPFQAEIVTIITRLSHIMCYSDIYI